MSSQICLSRRSRDVGTPNVRIHWVFLVDVDLEELVVSRTLEVLEPKLLSVTNSVNSLSSLHLRVHLLEVRINEPLLSYLSECAIGTGNKISLAIQWAVVRLLDNLDCECEVGR